MVRGVQGWRSGESTRLPPMWPGFDSRSRRHMWVEFVVVLAPRGFSLGTPVFPSPLKNQHWQIPIRSGMHRHTLNELPSTLKALLHCEPLPKVQLSSTFRATCLATILAVAGYVTL